MLVIGFQPLTRSLRRNDNAFYRKRLWVQTPIDQDRCGSRPDRSAGAEHAVKEIAAVLVPEQQALLLDLLRDAVLRVVASHARITVPPRSQRALALLLSSLFLPSLFPLFSPSSFLPRSIHSVRARLNARQSRAKIL